MRGEGVNAKNSFLRKFSQHSVANSGKEALTILTCFPANPGSQASQLVLICAKYRLG